MDIKLTPVKDCGSVLAIGFLFDKNEVVPVEMTRPVLIVTDDPELSKVDMFDGTISVKSIIDGGLIDIAPDMSTIAKHCCDDVYINRLQLE